VGGKGLVSSVWARGAEGEVCRRDEWGDANCTYLGVVERCETDAGWEGQDGYGVVGAGWGLLAVSAAGGVVEAVLEFLISFEAFEAGREVQAHSGEVTVLINGHTRHIYAVGGSLGKAE